MSYPELKRGDKSEVVKTLQTYLNRIGSMIEVDGDFGVGTVRAVRYAQAVANQQETGIANDELWGWLEVQPEPFQKLDTNGVAFIAKEETGGLSYYNAVSRWPHYPGYYSGVTIGVGYDLKFNTEHDFREYWGRI